MYYIVWNKNTQKWVKGFHNQPTFITEYSKQYNTDQYETIYYGPRENWYIREEARLDNGEYANVVWYKEPWAQYGFWTKRDYPHIKLTGEDTNLMYFTDSRYKGDYDVQTPIKPGKYLKTFYGEVLSDIEIKYWSDKHREAYGEVHELLWASTPDEIAKVYQMDASFESCMQEREYYWYSEIGGHPARVYGAGDLKVAYIGIEDRLISRALVWFNDNGTRVGRIYGDVPKLKRALRTVGIRTDSDNSTYDVMDGARIAKIDLSTDNEHRRVLRGMVDDQGNLVEPQPDTLKPDIVCPYIDGEKCYLKPDNTSPSHVIITSKNDPDAIWFSVSKMGYAPSLTRCPCCDKFMAKYEEIIHSLDDRQTNTRVCDDCSDVIGFYCRLSRQYYSRFNFTIANGLYPADNADVCYEACRKLIFKSTFSGKWKFSDEKVVIGKHIVAASEIPQMAWNKIERELIKLEILETA